MILTSPPRHWSLADPRVLRGSDVGEAETEVVPVEQRPVAPDGDIEAGDFCVEWQIAPEPRH